MSIVITSGGFDPLHIGHVEYLRRAKKMSGKHICIVNSDDFLDRKKGYHLMGWIDRMTIVGSLKYVDEVYASIDKDDTVCETLRLIRTWYQDDTIFFVKGGDRSKDEIPEAKVCEELHIQVIEGLGDKIRSSSDIIEEAVRGRYRDIKKRVL